MGRSNMLFQTLPPAPVVSTSRLLLPCPRRQHQWMSTSRLLLPCPAAPAPVDEYVALAPAVYAAPSPVDEYVVPAPAVIAAPAPVEYIALTPAAPVETSRLLLPCTRHKRQWWSTLHLRLLCFKRQRHWTTLLPRLPCPKCRRRCGVSRAFRPYTVFSLSPDAETYFPIVTGTKSRKGIETPTCSLSRRRLVDEAGHELDVQVERVMRASVARLGYEWRRHKKERETVGGDSAASQS